ncbi:MAG: YceI family protein [Alphaproteobacteria bacterium]|nr:YceI family protein [Alphaproteobacteria bacterium]
MLKRATAAALCTFLITQAPPAIASDPFVFDKSHANIAFSLSHLGFSTAHGRFGEFDGEARLDLDDPANSQLEVTIETASVDTFFAKRDEHLRSADFFNVTAHPTMTFKSTKVERTGENKARMVGDLTLLGVTKPVALDVTLNAFKENPINNKMTAGFTATGSLKRSEFGMTAYVPAVGDTVALRIDMEMQKVK